MKEKEKFPFRFELSKIKKRKLKKGETEYPKYVFKTIEEVFEALTPENMNRFFKAFKDCMSISVHMREMTTILAKENAKKDGVEMNVDTNQAIKMTSFTWIDD